MTPIFIAIRSGSSDAALLLIEGGVNVNQALRDGTTPLHHAATRSLKSVVDVLTRAKGVNIDARDKDRKTPFLAACDVSSYVPVNHIEVLKLLAERGANVKAVDKDRRSGLHLAVRSYNYEIAEVLLSLDVNVNAKDKRGRTPLDYCYSKSKISELLKRHGAE